MIKTADNHHIRTLYLDDPGSFNSLTEELVAEVTDALNLAIQDSNIRAIILSSEGKLFCAGGNLKNFLALTHSRDSYINELMERVYNPFGHFLRSLPKPLICAVNGPAIGAGVGLALSGDLTIAARSAYFSLPFVPKLGVVPDMGASWLISRTLPYQQALGYTLTGEPISAEEAARTGLIWRCHEPDNLMKEAHKLAESLSNCSPAAFRRSRQMVRSAAFNSYEQQLELERQFQTESFIGNAFEEGLNAFRERREPDFIRHGDD